MALVMSLAGVDLVAGIVVRIWTGKPVAGWLEERTERLQKAQMAAAIKEERTYRVEVPPYHHGLAPNFSGTGVWGNGHYSVVTNELGFKANATGSVVLRPTADRYLLMGDSFAEGIGVPYPQTFAGLIQQTLAAQNIELLNGAASSYSPVIYWRKTRSLIEDSGLLFDHLIVLVDISDLSDESEKFMLSSDVVVQRPASDRYRSFFESNFLFSTWVIKSFHLDVALRPYTRREAGWTLDQSLYEQYGRTGQDLAQRYMDLLLKLVREHSIDMTIVVYPWPDQIRANDLDSFQVSIWREWSDKNTVGFVNLFPCFINHNSDLVEREQVIDTLFINRDVHWNEAGHLAVAKWLTAGIFENRDACE